jgi:hypothetical protein
MGLESVLSKSWEVLKLQTQLERAKSTTTKTTTAMDRTTASRVSAISFAF